jgi:molybdopterin-guanine dinucleotide biosynthesis protein A
MQIVGILLVGGMSRRFGKPKAFVLYKNRPFYQWAKQALAPYVNQTVIVSHPSLMAEFECRGESGVVKDLPLFQGKGPLAGIYTVMKQNESEWYAVLPCDAPKITSHMMGKIISFIDEETDAVVPVIGGKTQPLMAVYHRRAVPAIEQLLKEGDYRMSALLERCRVYRVTEKELGTSGKEFENINDAAGYKELLNRAEN